MCLYTRVNLKSQTRNKLKSSGSERQKGVQNSDEQRLAQLFADANERIDKVESDSLRSKIKIVKDIAQQIEKEGLIPTERIANEIVHQLKGRISAAYVRRNLDDRYKDGHQSNNAKKQKVAIQVSPTNPKQLTLYSDIGDPKAATKDQQIRIGVDGHETTDQDTALGDQSSKQGIPISPHQDIKQLPQVPQQHDLPNNQSSQQSTTTESPTAKKSPQTRPIRVLIDWDELQEKIAEVHHKDIKNIWLCGRVDENDKLIDMVLEREQPLKVVD